jgi:hypothetical protein
MFKIEKNVPMNKRSRVSSERTLFLMSLEVGDSFECTRREYSMIRSYAKAAKVKLSSSLVVPAVFDELVDNQYTYRENDILRVWRIE